MFKEVGGYILSMKVACAQLDVSWENPAENFEKAKKLANECVRDGAQMICFPELFSTGVTLNSKRFAQELGGSTCNFLSTLAKENRIYIVGSFIEDAGKGLPRNTLVAYDNLGKMIGKYSKTHLFTLGEEHNAYRQGGEITVFDALGVRFCPLICYDLRFQDEFKKGLELGAQVFIVCASWPSQRRGDWVSLLEKRALENKTYVVGVNQVGRSPNNNFSGDSVVHAPDGRVLARAGARQQIITADLL